MMTRLKSFLIVLPFIFLFGCSEPVVESDPKFMTWEEIEKAARGTKLNMLAWLGDSSTNRYLEDFLAPKLKEKYDIEIEFASVAGPRIISFIMAEREAGKTTSEADMVWMAGRQSYQMRELNALYGPITDLLPNAQYLDLESPFIGKNYEIPLEGMEVPWGQGQFLLITDKSRVPSPPRNMEELELWVKENPGRFTFDPGFVTLSFLRTLFIEISGDREQFTGEFRGELYLEYSQKLWEYLERLRPFMWRNGEAFARNPAQLHQMFANGEVDFTMSYNNWEVDKRISQGVFKETAYAFTWDSGTPKNATYLSVINNAPNKAAALVVINYLISPEAQLEKMSLSGMGENSVLNINKLPQEWQNKFNNAENKTHSPNIKDAEQNAIVELRPEYITRLYNDFIKNFINARP